MRCGKEVFDFRRNVCANDDRIHVDDWAYYIH
jgi:hypothetical protein